MLRQRSDWNPDLAQHCTEMRLLLKKGAVWDLTPGMRKEFMEAKATFTNLARKRLHPFNPTLQCKLLTDASRLHGLGFMLIQEAPGGLKNIIKCGSVSLKSAQKNYSVTELEGFAVWYATHKCEYFLAGWEFDVFTDHHALIRLFNKEIRDIDNLCPQKLWEKMLVFNPVIHAA